MKPLHTQQCISRQVRGLRGSSHKAACCGIAAAVFACFGIACSGTGKGGAPSISRAPARANPSAATSGDQWGELELPSANASGSAGKPGRASPAQPSAPASSPAAPQAAPGVVWSLVLGTFTEGDHQVAAQRMIANLQTIAPQVRGARVQPGGKGSMVLIGRYAGRDDPVAKADQERLKALRYQGRPVFNRVLLTAIEPEAGARPLHRFDLMSARRDHPKVDPLYTLDVAVWDDFGSGKLSYDDIRRGAEAYASSLRAQGYEAYFYHDDVNQRSIVTVGLFDHRAIDPRSGLYSAEVAALLKKFKVRMANGEPLAELRAKYPRYGSVPQEPRLVLVPMK